MRLRDRARGLAAAALVGLGAVLVRIGAKLDGVEPEPEPEDGPPPPQNPLTPEALDLVEPSRIATPKPDADHRPLHGSVRERYALAREQRGL